MWDMDLGLEAWVSSLIELNKLEWMLGVGEAWKPGEKLKLLLAGYNGTRNTARTFAWKESSGRFGRSWATTIFLSA